MLLVIDVGNTNLVLGVYHGNRLIKSWRMTTGANRTADETGIFIHELFDTAGFDCKRIQAVIISSVVPDIMYSLTQGIRKYFGIEAMIVSSGMKTGIVVKRDNPAAVGADRIVDLVAANEIYGGPAIVIDYGTANTFDVINEKSEFITGLITPGIGICADALYRRAAQLPKVEIKKPKSVIVKNTVGSIQAGLVMGHIGQTKHIIKTLKEELDMPDMKVIATGGLAKVIDPNKEIFDILDPVLTLKGLQILYHKNK
ncbi:type III pantothenate kinase [Chakrabartyella piscis]|uniref:type III pantothenate kinase n=1 Tax=Chakrabartyella piscis TaxID=2918914 RepID=UPI0029583C7A|nr:type III pantothenate kinase [Chakrabartyella piscis]